MRRCIMGFWIMALSFVIGIAMIVIAFKRDFTNTKKVSLLKASLIVIGAALVVFAVFLGTPFGAEVVMKLT